MHEETFFRMMTLKISDSVSSLLKINFDIKNLDYGKQVYSSFLDGISEHSCCGLFKLGARGMAIYIDPKIIYILSNRMLGGEGVIEKKMDALYTDSEKFFAKEMINLFKEYYSKHEVELEFVRIETNIKRIHYFFPEETIYGAKCLSKINDEETGVLAICHPIES